MQRWKQKMSQIRNTQQMESSAWVNLKIRTATLADATQIFQIANSLKINYKDPQENGFLVYTKSAQDYGKIIESTPYFYVAERDGEVIGFLYCFDDVVMKKLEDNDLLKGEDKTFPFLYSQKRPFVLADQMGIIKK